MKKNESSRMNWVSVYSAQWEGEAEVVRSRLETENVPAVVNRGGWSGLGLLGPRGGIGSPMVECDVLVPENRVAEAKKILNTEVEITDFGAE